MSLRSMLFAVLALAAAGLPAQANMVDQIVRSKCSSAVQSEFSAAGRNPPAGMVDFTCDCVVQQIHKGNSINQASETCKSLASQKYSL